MTDTNTDIVARLRRAADNCEDCFHDEVLREAATEIEGLRKERDDARAKRTPAAQWRVDGKPDPFVDYLDHERAWLCRGDLTDDVLANAVFLEPSIGYLTAAKERIRWLSRHLLAAIARAESAEAKVRELETALRFYADPDSYVAIAFFGDRPCGDFIEDFDEVTDDFGFTVERPGKRARASLSPKGT